MDGILVINKPAGMTSFDVIARLRKRYGQKKFGHCGTLDPMAAGVLVVLAGSACRILNFIQDTDKEYEASLQLGASFDTDDIFGKQEQTRPVRDDFDFESVLDTFKGKQHQLVPKASAKKVNGKKLYEYLRAGQPVPQVYADVEIYDIEPLDRQELSFRIRCSSGTYIRSICRDFGEKTGNLAAMKSLVRTRANGFDLSEAQDLEASEHTVYPIERLLNYPKIQAERPEDVRCGKKLILDTEADRVLLADKGQLLALYDRCSPGENLFSCTRGLWT